ncbi:uncharacterized protein LOC123295653 isoform X2 [Chrysoperla carnea]|uniref:uncharacterized protein LOC123295653 isoform X2 n=1 Tax=Chrysoperla carnea TaxID=189513 RepID=UPI001D07453F|nr:uncharacterized protein LOC123295653 isoform X2 [Chrysoperla carnea]
MSGSHTPYKIIRNSIYTVVNKDEEIYSKIEMDSQQSHIFNLQLIELVKKNPLLYDHSHPGHKNKIAKEQCWVKISEQLNFDVDSVKKRYRNLRDRFVRERRLGTKGWRLYNQLEFFSDYLPEPRRYSGAIKEESKNTTHDSSQIITISNSLPEHTIPEPWNARKLFVAPTNEDNSDAENQQSKTKKRKYDIEEFENSKSSFSSIMKNTSQTEEENYNDDENLQDLVEYEEEHLEEDCDDNIKQIYKDDEDILFLLSLAPALKRMTRPNRNRVKIKLLEIISEHDV